MARTVSGSGAVIEPIFDEVFGVRAVKVVDGGIAEEACGFQGQHINTCTRSQAFRYFLELKARALARA